MGDVASQYLGFGAYTLDVHTNEFALEDVSVLNADSVVFFRDNV